MFKLLPAKFLLFLFFAFFVSACSILPTKSKNGPITLKFWGVTESATVVNEIITTYKKTHPNVNVSYEKKSIQQYREALETQIAKGIGPDIFMFHNTWTPMLKEELLPITADIISASQYKTDYYPAVISDLRNTEKKFVGAPTGIDGLALYWNEAIFRAAGIPAPPESWQEVDDIAKRLTVRGPDGNIRTAGIALGTTNNVDHFSDIFALMVIQNDGDLKTPTDKESSDALDYYVHFAQGQNRVWDETMPSSTAAFIGGNLAMYFGPSSRAAQIKAENPTLNFRVSPVPQLEGGKTAWASYWAVGVSAKTEHPQAALEFLKFLQEDQVRILIYTLSAKNDGKYNSQPYAKTSLAQKLASDPIFGAYITDAPYAKSFPLASNTFDNGLNDQMIKIYQKAINDVISNIPATRALETAAKSVKETLIKYGTTF